MHFRALPLVFVLASSAAPAQDSAAHAAAQAEFEKIAASVDGRMGLVVRDLATGEEFAIEPDREFPQGSSIKAPILLEVFRQSREKRFHLDELRPIRGDEKVGGSGVLRLLGSSASRFTFRDLATLMILESDNTATNVLLDRVGMDSVNQTLDRLGLHETRVRRRMMDTGASARGVENTSTPREMARFYEMLHRGETLDRELCLDVLAVLRRAKPSPIASGVPAGVALADKPGGIAGVACDSGIVYLPRRPFVVAAMTTGAAGGGGDAAIAKAVRLACEYFGGKRPAPVFSETGVRLVPELVRDPQPLPDGPVPFDLILRGGRILDGTGAPAFEGDLAIRDGRIAAVGKLPGDARAARVLDCRGLVVAPGFLDILDHSGGALPRDGRAENKIRQGITTAITGEGGTPAPIEELDDWFARLESTGIAIHFGTFVGAGQVRRAILGESHRAPSPAELAQMQGLVEIAMRKGCFGLSSALIYPPGSAASTDELVALASVAARFGGLYASHVRGEADEVADSIREAIAIGERSGAPVEIFHLKCSGRANWGRMEEVGAIVEAARVRGVEVSADVYPYTGSSTSLSATVPSWAHEGGDEALLRRLRDPETRDRIKRAMVEGGSGDSSFVRSADSFENVVVASVRTPKNKSFQGKSVEAIAKIQGKEARDALLDLLVEEDLSVNAFYFKMSEDDLRTAMRFPWVSFGTDAGALTEAREDPVHPRAFGTFPRILARYVRDEKVLPLEEAVRKMTSLPAQKLRLADRGRLAPGLLADVVAFDLEAMEDLATFENPIRYSKGMRIVIVAGEVVLDGDRHTGALPGRVLRGAGYAGIESR